MRFVFPFYLTLALFVFLSSPVLSQNSKEVTTKQLMNVCQEALQIMDEGEDFPPDTGEGLSCYHYFKGYRDALFVDRRNLINSDEICIPSNMGNNQLIRLFMEAAYEVPEERDEPASVALGGILSGALPCSD